MSKWVLFAGMLVAGVLVYQVKTEELSVDSAFSYLQSDAIKSTTTGNLSLMDHKQKVYGAILPADLELESGMTKFFAKLAKTQEVETFVILAEDHSGLDEADGEKNIVVNGYDFLSVASNLKVDDELKEELLKDNRFGEASYEVFSIIPQLPDILDLIYRFSPKHEEQILVITVSDDAEESEIEALAKALAEIGKDKKILVMTTTLFSQQNESTVNRFHDELAEDVILNFDKNGLEQMDVDSKGAIAVLFNYLELVGAKKAQIVGHFWNDEQSDFLVKFSKGEAIKSSRNLTVLAFGDMMLGRNVRTLIDNNGSLDYIFEKIKGYEGRFFEGADVVFGNLEGPIKGAGRKGGTAMVFAFNEDVAPFLKNSGFNMLSITNNHALDQGADGRNTTIAALNGAGLPWCGHPKDAEKESVSYGDIGDKKFAFVCFQDITHNLDQSKAVELIKEVSAEVDYLIVSIHWGVEYKHNPDKGLQIQPAHEFIDAGADFIIGHHPHVVQTFEIYNGKMIFYSLGNFVFDQYWSQDTQEELAIGIVLEDGARTDDDEGADEGASDEEDDVENTRVYLFPMRSDKSQSRLMVDEERTKWLEKFIGYGQYSEVVKNQIRDGLVEVP